MDEKQLKAAINMGNDIAKGEADIVALDNRSLELRGKKQKSTKSREERSEKVDKQVDSKDSVPASKTKQTPQDRRTKKVMTRKARSKDESSQAKT